MNGKNTIIQQSENQNVAEGYNANAPSPVYSVAVNAVNGVDAANAAKPPDAVKTDTARTSDRAGTSATASETKVLPLSRTILIWQGRVQDEM